MNIRNRIYKYVSFIYKDVIIKNKEHKKCNITKNRVLNNIVDRILMLHDDNDIKDEYSEFIEDNRKWLIPIENYHTDVTNYFTYRKVINEYKKKNNKKDLNSSDLKKIRNDNNIITLKHPINNIQDCDLNKFLHSHIKINKMLEDYNISAIKENNIRFKYEKTIYEIKKNIKLFQPLSRRSTFIPKYITLDSESIIMLFTKGNKNELLKQIKNNKDKLWLKFFKISKFLKSNKKIYF